MEQVKISWSQVRRVWGMLQCHHNVLCLEILDQNRPMCWSVVVTEKSTVGSPFFGTFPSDHIPEATMEVSIHFFIHSSNSCKRHQRIPGTFWSYHVHAPRGDTTTGKYGLENFRRENFSEISRRVLGPPCLLFSGFCHICSWGPSGRGLKLTAHLNLVWLRKNGVMPPERKDDHLPQSSVD